MNIILQGIDGIAGTHLTGDGEFLIVDIRSNDSSTTRGTAHNGTHTHHTTADDHHHVDIRHLCTADGVETHTHRFDEGTGTGCEQSCRNDFLPRHGDILAHGSPTLHTECLVMLTGIHTAVTTGGTLATVRIRIDGHGHAGLQALGHVLANADDRGTHFMARHHRHAHHRIASTEGAEVTTTKTHVLQLQEYLIVARLGRCKVDDLHHRRL